MSTLASRSRMRSQPNSVLAILRLGRPKFLLGGFALYGLGALTAHFEGFHFNPTTYWWGLLAATSIQLMTHYSNDYFDYEADLANPTPTRWSGGSRVLVRGLLPRIAGLWAAVTMAFVACLAMGALVVTSPERSMTLPISVLLVMLVLAWSYSSPPLRLHTRGLGEPTVAHVVPILTPFSGFVLQAGEFAWLPILLCLPLTLLATVMLLTLEFPDERGDRVVGKKSWVVVFGAKRVAGLCGVFIVLGFLMRFASVWLGVPVVAAQGWIWLLPLGVFQLVRLFRQDWRRSTRWSGLELGAVALFFFAVLADLIALSGWL